MRKLVSLLILSVLAASAWKGLDAISTARQVAENNLQQTLRLQAVMTQFETDLAQVSGDLKGAVEPALTAAGFSPQWRLAPATTLCDPVRLRQAVLALIENARVHATPGPLLIETQATPDGIRIAVEDSGPGLAPGFETLAFDPFQRASSSRNGSGLGLSVVRAVAEAHKGDVEYRPTREGSVFEIRVP